MLRKLRDRGNTLVIIEHNLELMLFPKNKWNKLKLIRDEANISIESKRADKIIGSSLEANIEIKIKDKDMYSLAQNHDFSEICITSSASILSDSSLENPLKLLRIIKCLI